MHGVRSADALSVIVMEYVATGPRSSEAMERAGRSLARLHGCRGYTAGLDEENFIGTLPQRNAQSPSDSWRDFFLERRIAPFLPGLPTGIRGRLESLDIVGLLDEPIGGCCLVHGDLWSGNLLFPDGEEPCFIDPAVYFGHHEVDLAMTRLFGGFDARFYAAYQEIHGAFDSGLEDRLALLNLYPLLVHATLFGAGYFAQIEETLRHFGG